MSVDRFEILAKYLTDATFISIEEKIQMIRLIKTPEELTILKEAALLADYAIQVGVDEIAEGKTEAEIVAKIEYEMKKKRSYRDVLLNDGPHWYKGCPTTRHTWRYENQKKATSFYLI